MNDAEAVWDRLAAAGIVRDARPDAGEPPLPWYLRALAAAAAWIAAVCVLSSTSLLFLHLFESTAGTLVVGAALTAAGAAVLMRARERVFIAQFGLAIAFAGEAALAYGIHHGAEPHTALAWMLVAVVGLVLLVAIADRTHRSLAALAIALCAFLALERIGPWSLMPPLTTIAFVASAFAAERGAGADALWRPASAGFGVALLAFAPLATIVAATARWRDAPPDMTHGATAILMAIAFVAVVAILCRRLALADRRLTIVALLGAVAIAALAYPVSGLLAALVVMLVAFATGRAALTSLGIVCGIAMLGYYYASLEATLLAKSASLLAIGIVLMAVGTALRRLARGGEATGDGATGDA